MSQPPAGGYPPPDQSQPGGYPPPAPGYQPPPAPGYQPPPAYTPPPAPGGYQPPPAPGYAPPPAGGYAPPPGAPGGYPPPAAGYQPPPPAYGTPPGPAGGGTPSIDISKVTTGNWIVIGLGVLLLIFSFFGWVSSSYASAGGWNNWWFLIILIELAITGIYAATILGVMKAGPIKPVFLFYGAAAAFVLYIIALIQIFASYSYSASDYCSGLSGSSLSICQSASSGASVGAGFGIWASIVLSAAFAYFIALWAQKTDKLPFKVPGPVL